MTMPFYVAPEQQMKDRADYARKGIARGRSVVVMHYADGILFVAENRSAALHKVSEIYDRTDVTGRGLANAYAQLLGTIFSSGGEKPYEVEIVVAELGITAEQDQIYRLTYDGSVADENNFAVMGGSADVITEAVGRGYRPGLSLADAIDLAVTSLASDGGPSGTRGELGVEALEVAILDRTRALPRKFRRVTGGRLAGLLAEKGTEPVGAGDPPTQDPAR